MARFVDVERLLADATSAGVASAAVVEVGRAGGVLWQEAFGRLSPDVHAPTATPATVFDLASLTKPIATTTLTMGKVSIDERVADRIGCWTGEDRAHVTIEDLLAHCSGLREWAPLFESHRGRAAFERAICSMALDYPPRTRSIYSDLGFILLGFILEDVVGENLDAQFSRLASRLDLGDIAFNPPPSWRGRTAVAAPDRWRKRPLIGEVQDENAAALGGAAGHAGLFGTVDAVGRFARIVLAAWLGDRSACARLAPRDVVRRFTARRDVPGSSRALGWDTMLPTSSCGTRMSPSAFGHVGFTGSSIWIDPAGDVYIVLLTNHVRPTPDDGTVIRQLRREVHDAVMDVVSRSVVPPSP